MDRIDGGVHVDFYETFVVVEGACLLAEVVFRMVFAIIVGNLDPGRDVGTGHALGH
jgi:hypothetical protein